MPSFLNNSRAILYTAKNHSTLSPLPNILIDALKLLLILKNLLVSNKS